MTYEYWLSLESTKIKLKIISDDLKKFKYGTQLELF